MSGSGGLANPAPAGLGALALACFTFYYLFTCPKAAAVLPLLGCWLLGGAIVQFTVAIIEILEGAVTGGNVFLFFSAFFMATGSLEMFVKYFAAANKWAIPLDTKMDGWAWLCIAILIFFWMFAYLKATSILFFAVLILEVAVILIAGMDLGLVPATAKPTAAYCLLGCGILAAYLSGAIVVNTAFGKSIMPITPPLSK